MFQATILFAVVIITAQAFDLKRNQLPTNSLVNLGKIDVSVYYNPPNGKPENDLPPMMNNEIFQAPLPLAPASHQSCPCSHMKSFGKDPSLAVLSKLFGGVSMANDVPQSPNCCDVFEIVDEDRPMDTIPFQESVEPFPLNNFPFNLPLSPPKPNSQYRPKAVEIVIIPNKKNNKSKQINSPREDIKVVGTEKKFYPKFKKMNKSQMQKHKFNDKTTSPQGQSNFEYGISNVEIIMENKPVNAPLASSTTLQQEIENGPSVKKDLNAALKTTSPFPTTKDATTTRTSVSAAEADVLQI